MGKVLSVNAGTEAGGSFGVSASGTRSSGQQNEADRGSPDSSENVEYRDLVLCALPVLRRASDGLSRNYGLRDKRSGYLNNIQSSALLLEDHLHKIESVDDL